MQQQLKLTSVLIISGACLIILFLTIDSELEVVVMVVVKIANIQTAQVQTVALLQKDDDDKVERPHKGRLKRQGM